MYKKLSREEERIIRESFDPHEKPPRRGTLVRNLIWFVVGFVVFVVIAYVIVSTGAAASGGGG